MEYRRLFETWDAKEGETFEDGWKNKLIWGDNKYVMSALLEKFAGKIDIIYIDPPFATGADFSFTAEIGEEDIRIPKEQSVIEEKAYRDTWGQGTNSYLSMMYERLVLMRDLLNDNGSIFVHCDYRVSGHMRLVMDEIFGIDNFRNLIVWRRTYAGKTITRNIPSNTDFILWYSKSENYNFNPITKPLSDDDKLTFKKDDKDGRGCYNTVSMQKVAGPTPGTIYDYTDNSGKVWKCPDKGWRMVNKKMKALENDNRLYFGGKTIREKYYLNERIKIGKQVDNLWNDIGNMNRNKKEDLGYPTQKPEELIERIIYACSNEGDLIADFFCGSGTTLAVAEKLNRRWIGCDLGRYAIHTARKRLMEIEKCKPFEILNLGKYERQVWQGISFDGKDQQTVLYEYLAFILKLYGVEPISGFSNIHGKNCKALVHVGSVDAPVTIDEIIAALKECASAGVKELHVLGWEWEMGLHELIEKEAKREGVKLVLKLIPNEVMEAEAVRKGDVRFFDMAYLKTNIKTNGNHEATVELTDFVIPNTELIPNEVRDKIKKWSDYVDYWAVDFNFQCDTFMNQWTSYRTHQDRSLKLKSDPHIYEKPGKYRILVKVIDIFGIDTSQAFEIQVK